MAYNRNIPQPTDQLTDSQGALLNNFLAVRSAWIVNHVEFDLANEGKHTHISLPEQAAGPTTLVDEIAVYSKKSTLTSLAELFVRKEGNTAEIEFTSAIAGTPGWTRLPSGILLKWGTASRIGDADVLLPVVALTIPAFSIIFSVQLTIVSGTGSDVDNAVRVTHFNNPAQFSVFASPRTTTGTKLVNFEYFIIGT